MPWVVGALGSRPARSKGIGRPSAGGREPKGKRHAVDLDTGVVACGTHDSLRIFDDWRWAPEDDWCRACEDVVDRMSP
jgi:hypothetical protein